MQAGRHGRDGRRPSVGPSVAETERPDKLGEKDQREAGLITSAAAKPRARELGPVDGVYRLPEGVARGVRTISRIGRRERTGVEKYRCRDGCERCYLEHCCLFHGASAAGDSAKRAGAVKGDMPALNQWTPSTRFIWQNPTCSPFFVA
jgi:hypothetical protein